MTAQTPLVFAMDFDDTFTAAPALWAAFIRLALKDGHRIYCVTARRNTDENIEILNEAFAEHEIDIPIVFSNLGSKMWIDDAPHALVHGH